MSRLPSTTLCLVILPNMVCLFLFTYEIPTNLRQKRVSKEFIVEKIMRLSHRKGKKEEFASQRFSDIILF